LVLGVDSLGGTMSIYGITHDKETQAPIQRLAIVGKLAIGEVVSRPCKGHQGPTCKKCGGTGKTTAPSKSDHFLFRKKNEQTHEWECDQELTKFYTDKCRAVWIVLLDDDPDVVFRTEMAWWRATECVCHGNGLVAIRRTQAHPEGEPWEPCGEGCPDLGPGKPCKPNGVLHFMLAEVPKLGGVWKFDTTGYRSIRQIHSSLIQLQNLFGRLAGIRAQLVVRPEKTSYAGKDGKKHTTTIFAVSLEIPGTNVRALVADATAPALAFDASRKALGTGTKVEYIEPDEPERAKEMQPEFYPGEEDRPVAPPKEPKRKSDKKKNGVAPEPQAVTTAETKSGNQTSESQDEGTPLKVRGKLQLVEPGTASNGSPYRKVRVEGHVRWLWTYNNYSIPLIHDPKTGKRIEGQTVNLFALLDGSVGLECEFQYNPKPGKQGGEFHQLVRITKCGKALWEDDGIPAIQVDSDRAPAKVERPMAPPKAKIPSAQEALGSGREESSLFGREPGESES